MAKEHSITHGELLKIGTRVRLKEDFESDSGDAFVDKGVEGKIVGWGICFEDGAVDYDVSIKVGKKKKIVLVCVNDSVLEAAK